MNIWYFIITPMSLGWLIPLLLIHRLQVSAWIYITLALFWGTIAYFAQTMYDWATNIGKRRGHWRLVAFRERLKPKVIPAARAALIIMAIMSIVFAIV